MLWAQQIKMSAYWMFVILVGYRLGRSHSAQPQSTCACNDQLQTVCVPPGDTVIVPCPKLLGEEVKYDLLQDEEIIYNHTLKPPNDRLGMQQQENPENKSVSFRLTVVNASSHGIYRCESTVMFPPPLRTVASDLRILVLVEGYRCCSNARTGQNCGFHWIWIVVLVSIYSTIATIMAIVFWVKLRRTDCQSDYMNTKPKAPRERRKKRGVQNPIPRHF